MSSQIKSELEFVNTYMDDLMKKGNNAIDFCSAKPELKSSKDNNMLYSKINNIVNDFYSCQKELIEKLNHEADLVKGVAKQYQELDNKLEEGANNL